MNNNKKLTQIHIDEISLSINPITKTIVVKQGDYSIEMTRNQVIGLKKLKAKEYETNVYTAQTFPYNSFKLLPSGLVMVSNTNQYNTANITLNSVACKGIMQFTESNKGRIAWDRDIKRR